jgi:uncharacterized membrane protein YdjX (TVP38/TMEM64 family)
MGRGDQSTMSIAIEANPAMDVPAAEGSSEQPVAHPHVKKGTKRLVVLLVVLVAAIAASYLLPVRQWLHDATRVSEAVRSLGGWIYPVGALAVAMMVACGIPRLLVCTVAAAALGFWRGMLLAEIGTVVGYYGVFLFIRWGGREWALHRWPKLQKWSDLVRDQGVLGVILLRHVPIHGTIINLGLGISRVKHRHFLIGTALGIIPESIPFLLVGAGIQKGNAAAMGKYVGIAVVAFVVIWIGAAYAMRAVRKSRSAAAAALLASEAALKETAGE